LLGQDIGGSAHLPEAHRPEAHWELEEQAEPRGRAEETGEQGPEEPPTNPERQAPQVLADPDPSPVPQSNLFWRAQKPAGTPEQFALFSTLSVAPMICMAAELSDWALAEDSPLEKMREIAAKSRSLLLEDD
jgi:hypothetical protein